MIELVDIREKNRFRLSYTKVASEFLNSPISEEEGGFIVNMMLYLDFIERRRGLKFVKLTRADWEGLWQATSLDDSTSYNVVA